MQLRRSRSSDTDSDEPEDFFRDHSDDDEAAAPSARPLVLGAVAGGLALVLGVLAIVLIVLISTQPDTPAIDTKATFSELEQGAMQAARQDVIKLTTLSTTNAEAQIKSLLADATGSFRDNLSQIATPLKDAVIKQKVTTVGKIVQTGVSASDPGDNTVTVLVAASQSVKNAASPSGEARTYRLMVKIQKVKNRYLVADMAFVA